MGERDLVSDWVPGAPPRSYPLGHTVTGSPHSVVVSLPTMADVIGYEEKHPETLAALKSGYPRFFAHAFLTELIEHLQGVGMIPAGKAFLLSSPRYLQAALAFAGTPEATCGEWKDLAWVVYPENEDTAARRLKLFLQHTGAAPSSRRAEDALVSLGLHTVPYPEIQRIAADGQIEAQLAPYLGVDASEVLLAQGGMNAFYALFESAKVALASSGRRRWVQLGWLYVDTIKILETMSGDGVEPIVWHDAFDVEGLETVLTPIGGEIAGIVAELPTNPLVQTPGIEALRALADRLGCLLILDPSIASVAQVDVLPWADAVVTSLTKFTAREGDVMLGAAVVNPARPWAEALRSGIRERRLVPYGRDLTRFAAELEGWSTFTAEAGRTAIKVARFLSAHPKVEHVWWSGSEDNRERFGRIAREAHGSPCAVLSFTVAGDLATFYDAVELAKGPSFGAAYSILSPFMYLAHYDLVSTEAGRAELAEAGVPPNLLRLSVGAESAEALIEVLKAALEKLA